MDQPGRGTDDGVLKRDTSSDKVGRARVMICIILQKGSVTDDRHHVRDIKEDGEGDRLASPTDNSIIVNVFIH